MPRSRFAIEEGFDQAHRAEERRMTPRKHRNMLASEARRPLLGEEGGDPLRLRRARLLEAVVKVDGRSGLSGPDEMTLAEKAVPPQRIGTGNCLEAEAFQRVHGRMEEGGGDQDVDVAGRADEIIVVEHLLLQRPFEDDEGNPSRLEMFGQACDLSQNRHVSRNDATLVILR